MRPHVRRARIWPETVWRRVTSKHVVSGHRIFLAGSLAAGEAPQVGGEIPLSLEIGLSKNTPHSFLEHSEKLPKNSKKFSQFEP